MADGAVLWVLSQMSMDCSCITANDCACEACGGSSAMGPIGNGSSANSPSNSIGGSSGSDGLLAAAVVEIGGFLDMVMDIFYGLREIS